MKLLVVLFAVVVAASAYPGVIPWASSVPQPWQDPWQAWQPAPVPKYVKVAIPEQVHAPAVHHVINVPQPAPVPPLHPQPLNIKVPHTQAVRLPQGHVKIQQPHLVGIEHYVPEPEIKVVAKPIHHDPW